MLKHILFCAALVQGVLLFAVETRLVRLEDFAHPKGAATLGGEFPGARAKLSFAGEGDVRHARLAFDLTKGNYVGYALRTPVPAGASGMIFRVRTPGAARPRLFCRVLDADGQYHMFRAVGNPSAEWSDAACDFAAPHGHWCGRNDGVIRWPLRDVTLGIEVDKAACPTGALEIAEFAVRTTAARADLPAVEVFCMPSRFGALYGPQEDVAFRLSVFLREHGARLPTFAYAVSDWRGREVLKRTATRPDIVLKPADLGDGFGAFRIDVAPVDPGTDVKPVSAWFARLTRDKVAPCPWIGSGLHGGHGWGHGDLRFLDILATAGVGVVRDEPGWANVEREKGVYKVPDNFDKLVDGLHARGIGFNVILDYGNRLYENPVDPDAFAKWCAFMARRYGDKVRTWEIWNEPQTFWFRDHYGKTNDVWVGKFVELTRKADDAIRAVRPDADVAVTAEDVWPLLKQMLELGVAKAHNIVSFHPYCHGQPRPEREVFSRNGLKELREAAAAHGGANRFIITEAGWTTYTGKMKYLEVAGGYPKSSYVHQAQYLVRMYAQARQQGVEYACQYDFRDDGPDRSYTENNFGLVHENYTPKPSLAAVAELARRLGDAEPRGDCSQDPAKYRFYRFHRPDGDAYLAWAIEGACEVDLPEGLAGRVQVLDLMGNPLLRPSTKEGRLALDECPVYLEVVDGAFEEMVAMPDGVKLYTIASKPAPGVKCPVVIQRNPYVKERPVDLASFARGQAGTLRRGYARVIQHCRGAGMSEGVRVPYENERVDGLALLEWVRKLPWYNGEIYLEGGSYLSSVHWAYLDTDPKDVKGAFLAIQEVDRYNVCYRNGFFKAGLHGGWFAREYHKTDHALTRNRGVSFSEFPLEAFSTRFWGRPDPAFDNVIRHPRRDDPFWKSDEPGSGADYRHALRKSSMPILLKTGFYDIYTEGLCDMWREIPAARRANCALLIDAYDHGGRLSDRMKGSLGEFPDGARADEQVEALDWFDAVRKGTSCAGAERNRTKYYALWENAWHVEPALVDGARRVTFALGAGSRSYTYDPKRPLPDFPGSGGICFGGMQVQPAPDFRDDVVSFVLPPLTERLDVRGRMTLDLAVASDCADTCFYARVDVRKPDGRWYLLRDDITSLSRGRRGVGDDAPYRAGTEATVSFRFADHAFRLEPGDVLRVDVASGCSQFAPHANVAGDQFAVTEPKVARNTVFAAQSRLVLHALPRE